jgi:hypothetical protein
MNDFLNTILESLMRSFITLIIIFSLEVLSFRTTLAQNLKPEPNSKILINKDNDIDFVNSISFEEALKIHLDAINNRDIDGFIESVVQDERLLLIMPNGTKIKGFHAVRNFHIKWFADHDWSIETNIVHQIETKAMSSVILDVTYSDLNANGKPYTMKYYLNLTFVFENMKWVLISDQNTKY